MTFTNDDLRTLSIKLDAVDFTDGERAALQSIIDAACSSDDDVSGFGLGNTMLGDVCCLQANPLGGGDNGSFFTAKP